MTLSKHKTIDQITADEYGTVSVRERTDIVEDGAVLSSAYHRHVVAPGDDLKNEDKRVQAIAKAARADAKPLPKA
jgi:hypothetical protein